ncbi:MAG: tRNA pseudouridine(38-40) synthase TruA [Deltaproteobacteria bacterium RIFCSPHIGHO2_12_FULL_43_9]|nr:MAG: tRNA pseudouridine(38-40) synthase TruA [Deltaproteobacteria bacterium RIFCSPHIGHO2_12_FULL_43_9]
MPRKIRLDIEYDGTSYHGWQRQKNSSSIQQAVEEALERIIKEYRPVVAASRTDRGVHALNQVAHFWTSSDIPDLKLLFALNSALPKDIVVKNLKTANSDFHAMKKAHSKLYCYLIENGKFPTAHRRNISWWIPQKLNVENMKTGAREFIGEKDFKSLMTGRNHLKSTTKIIFNIEIEETNNIIRILIHGNGFLKQMVRAIVGTLVQIGMGKISPKDLNSILQSRERSKAGKNAPSKGLCLIKVFYEPRELKFETLSNLCRPANPLTFYH